MIYLGLSDVLSSSDSSIVMTEQSHDQISTILNKNNPARHRTYVTKIRNKLSPPNNSDKAIANTIVSNNNKDKAMAGFNHSSDKVTMNTSNNGDDTNMDDDTSNKSTASEFIRHVKEHTMHSNHLSHDSRR